MRKNEKPRRSGAWVRPVTRRGAAKAASFDEWHHTTPDLCQLQFAPATVTGDIRTFARNFARWKLGTNLPVLHNPDAFLRLPAPACKH